MSTDIIPVGRVVSPRTGEILTLDAPTVDLAGYLADVREIESDLRDGKRAATEEILRRLDAQARWTEHIGSVKISAPSPAPGEEFDAAALHEELLALVDAGALSVEAVDRAVEVVVTYKPHAAGIKALRKLGGRVAAVVDAHARTVEKRRTVTVDRRSATGPSAAA